MTTRATSLTALGSALAVGTLVSITAAVLGNPAYAGPSAQSTPSPKVATPRATAPNDTVNAAVLKLYQKGQPVNNIAPSDTPYDFSWGVDNSKNDHAILITRAAFTLTTPEECTKNFTLSDPSSETLSQRIDAGAIGNGDGSAKAPWLHSPGFLFQANGKECQNARFNITVKATYQNIAQADELKGATSTEIAGKPVTTVTASQQPTLVGSFSAPDAMVAPAGTVQFQVDGVNYGSPVKLTSGRAELPTASPLSVGQHSVVAVLTDPVYGTVTAAPTTVTVTAASSPSASASQPSTPSPSSSVSASPTASPTTASPSASASASASATANPSASASATASASASASSSASPSASSSPSVSPSATASPTASVSPSATASPTTSVSPTATVSVSPTAGTPSPTDPAPSTGLPSRPPFTTGNGSSSGSAHGGLAHTGV